MVDRIKSGIPGLDDLLGGGLPSGGTYAVLGGTGTGKTIFCLQYLYNGAVESGDPGVYVILEEDKERLVSNVLNLGWDIAKLEASGKLRVVPYTKSLLGDLEATFERGMMSGDNERASRLRQFLTIDSLYQEIEQNCRSIGAKRVVIDSLSVLTMLSDNQIVGRMQFLWLMDKLRKLKVTVLVIVEEDVGLWKDMLFTCDGIIHLLLREMDGVFERGIIIEKVRGIAHDTGIRPFKILNDGVRVYPQEIFYMQAAPAGIRSYKSQSRGNI
jgi:KaiC/GvpD/RAD55 family RecA-like ATPase